MTVSDNASTIARMRDRSMNEEAMTPDKEQVVEPLSAAERPLTAEDIAYWRGQVADRRVDSNHTWYDSEVIMLVGRLLATLDAERGDRERQFREWKAAQDISVAEWQRQIDAAALTRLADLLSGVGSGSDREGDME